MNSIFESYEDEYQKGLAQANKAINNFNLTPDS